MSFESEKKSVAGLITYLEDKSKPRRWYQPKQGNQWPFLLVLVPWAFILCGWATQYHSSEIYQGVPMNLLWIWFALIVIAFVVAQIGWSANEDHKQLEALTELFLKQKEK